MLTVNKFVEEKLGKAITEVSHKEKYQTVVNAVGIHKFATVLPESPEKIKAAFKDDEYLNNISLHKWDVQAPGVARLLGLAGMRCTLSECVSTLKEAARMTVEGEF